VLIAITAVNIVAMCLAVALERHRDEKQQKKELAEKKEKN